MYIIFCNFLFVQLLKSYEHLSLPLAKTVLHVVESGNNRSSLIELIVKQIAEKGQLESMKQSSNQDTIGGKSYCVFLVELAKRCPQLVLPSIEHLLPCLESDVSDKLFLIISYQYYKLYFI